MAIQPQQPQPYLIIFVKPAIEINIDRMITKRASPNLLRPSDSIPESFFEFSNLDTNPKIIERPVDIKQIIKEAT